MPMSHADTILAKLKSISPYAICDDCLSSSLGIRPRQTINGECRLLRDRSVIERATASCDACNKVKLTNTVATTNDYQRIGK